MLKQFHTALLAVLVLGFLSSCQSANNDVRDAARTNLESTAPTATPDATTVTPDQATPAAPTGPTTTMTFEETTFDFGTVAEGELVSHTYKFKNTGSEPLILSNAKGSCGCTVPKWPREPIAPGATGEIVVEFNSKGKKGARNQKVTITANTNPPQTFLSLTGTVEPTDGATQPNIQVTQ